MSGCSRKRSRSRSATRSSARTAASRPARHTFCGNCGVALHALPKRSGKDAHVTEPTDPPRPTPPRLAAGDASTRLGGRGVLVGFAVVLGVILLLAAIVATLDRRARRAARLPARHRVRRPAARPATPTPRHVRPRPRRCRPRPPPCRPGPSASVPGRRGRARTSASSSSTPDLWAVDTSDGRRADLVFQGGVDALLIVAGRPGLGGQRGGLCRPLVQPRQRTRRPTCASTRSDKNAILGPSIGAIDGVGRTLCRDVDQPAGRDEPGRGEPRHRDRRADHGRGRPGRLEPRPADRHDRGSSTASAGRAEIVAQDLPLGAGRHDRRRARAPAARTVAR